MPYAICLSRAYSHHLVRHTSAIQQSHGMPSGACAQVPRVVITSCCNWGVASLPCVHSISHLRFKPAAECEGRDGFSPPSRSLLLLPRSPHRALVRPYAFGGSAALVFFPRRASFLRQRHSSLVRHHSYCWTLSTSLPPWRI